MEKPSILVVDDEANIRGTVTRWFEIRGFEVHEADNGLAAVALCGARTFDVITMDLEMPGMGGLDAIVAIRKLGLQSPILVMTGMPGDTRHALAAGATRILTKPLRLSELELEVRRILAT